MGLKLFPWENNEKPYWVNPENGLEWYVEKSTTDACTVDRPNKLKKLNAISFLVVKRADGKITPLERVLIDVKTNDILACETSLEAMYAKIDMLRISLTFDNN